MVSPAFSWVGNHPALDLINTEHMIDAQPVDLLTCPDAMRHWIAAAEFDHAPVGAGSDTVRLLHFSWQLRSALRTVLVTESPSAEAIETLNQILASTPGMFALDADRYAVQIRAAGQNPQVQMDLAVAAIDIFDRDRHRVRVCEGASCTLMFLDTSKSGRRRWCDMTTCGNRAKAAAFAARTRTRR